MSSCPFVRSLSLAIYIIYVYIYIWLGGVCKGCNFMIQVDAASLGTVLDSVCVATREERATVTVETCQLELADAAGQGTDEMLIRR